MGRENNILDDPFKKRAHQFKFGEKLCESKQLLSKSILLSKQGFKIYFLKRDFNKKADELMSAELMPTRPGTDEQ